MKFVPWLFYVWERTALRTKQEIGCAPEVVWTLERREKKSIALGRVQTRDHPVHGLITIPHLHYLDCWNFAASLKIIHEQMCIIMLLTEMCIMLLTKMLVA